MEYGRYMTGTYYCFLLSIHTVTYKDVWYLVILPFYLRGSCNPLFLSFEGKWRVLRYRQWRFSLVFFCLREASRYRCHSYTLQGAYAGTEAGVGLLITCYFLSIFIRELITLSFTTFGQ
jgi:hypothetical protein